MKRSILLPFFLSLVALLAVTGCKHNPKGVTTITNPNPEVPVKNDPGGPITPRNNDRVRGIDLNNPNLTQTQPLTNPDGTVAMGERPDGDADRAALAAQTVYFDFDRAVVKASEKSKLDGVAAYMKNERNVKLRIEGHCDERGTEEYNRSLGERRALALREALVASGVAPDRITTESFGNSKPADAGHDETAWSKNRRGEFVVIRPRR